MAPGRPYWKGYLKLALVSCPIALYTASSSSERVSFRQINKKTGNRLRQQLVDEVTREPVEGEDKGRGYEYSKGAYIEVDDDELDAVAVESNHTIEIDSFVPRSQIDERYLDSPYYMRHCRILIRQPLSSKTIASIYPTHAPAIDAALLVAISIEATSHRNSGPRSGFRLCAMNALAIPRPRRHVAQAALSP